MHVREYNDGDWPRLCEIHDAARKIELALANLDDAFLPLTIAAEKEGLFDYSLLVAESEGQVTGFTAFTDDELCWLYVDPEKQRNGIGSTLIGAVLERNPGSLTVEILKGNTPARKAYEKAGFVLVREVSGVMPGNERFKVTVDELTYIRNA